MERVIFNLTQEQLEALRNCNDRNKCNNNCPLKAVNGDCFGECICEEDYKRLKEDRNLEE